MVTIGINGNEANVTHRVGIGQYSFGLLNQLSKLNRPDVRFQVYLSRQPQPDMPKESEKWHYQIFGPSKLWMFTGLQRKLIEEKISKAAPDVFFTSTHYSPLYMPMPSVISIMDLAFEKFPRLFTKKDYYQLKYWTAASVMIASKILTISEQTKRDICSTYAVSSDKVVVTYPGYDQKRFNLKVKNEKGAERAFSSAGGGTKLKIKETIQKYKIKLPYIIFIGTVQPRKNLVRLLEAFSKLSATSYQLVVAGMISEGRGGWQQEPIFAKVKELDLEKRVIFTGFVPDPDLPYLLAGAKAYVLPSLYEGFGIPPIEAMATGVPVVVSRVSSLPEVCGEAPVYIEDPYQVSSIKKAIDQILAMKTTELVKKVNLGLKWVRRYNWEVTAQKTLDVLIATAGK